METAKLFTGREDHLGCEDIEEILVPQNRLGGNLTTHINPAAELLTRALELSITQENNSFGPWLQQMFHVDFVNSRHKLILFS